MFELLMLLAAAGAPHPADSIGLFRNDDYPASSVEADEQGKTTIRVNVAADGTPTVCKIVRSSHFAALDSATCKVILKRGRFVETAKQHKGRPFRVEWSVGWQLATAATPVDVDHDLIIYALTDGQISGCRSEVATWRPPDPKACDDHRQSAQADLESLPDERAIPGRAYVLEAVTIPGDHRGDDDVGRGNGKVLIGRDSVVLTIDADGKVVRCEEAEHDFRTPADMKAWCKSAKAERFEPLETSSVTRALRRLTRIGAAYFAPADTASTAP